MRTPLDALITEKALAFVASSRNTALTDLVAESEEHANQFKNVCAKVSPVLSDRIDNIAGLLGISKRAFLEAAFLDACIKAEAIIEAEGVHEFCAELSAKVPK